MQDLYAVRWRCENGEAQDLYVREKRIRRCVRQVSGQVSVCVCNQQCVCDCANLM